MVILLEVALAQPVPFVDIDKIVDSLDPSHSASPAQRQWMRQCLTAFQKNRWDTKMKRAVDSDSYRKGLEELADKMGKPREELIRAWEKGVSRNGT